MGKKEKLGIGWIKGPCEPKKKKKSSRREQDGHMEQGGPDSEAEPHSSSLSSKYRSVFFVSILLDL